MEVKEIAEKEGVTPEAVYYWIDQKLLPATWENGRLVVSEADYAAFVRPTAGRKRKEKG